MGSSADYHIKSYRSRLSPTPLPYRSKSYQNDLNRLTPAPSSLASQSIEFSRSDRGRSYSALNLDRNYYAPSSISSINAYSRHYNHHNYSSRISSTQNFTTTSFDSGIKSKMNSRSRFRSRSTFKSCRSHSANPPSDRDSVSMRSSMARISTLSDIQAMRFSKSLSDLRATYSRINYSNDLTNSLLRERLPSRSSNGTDSNILNPDIYLRWLKNKRDLEQNAFSNDFSKYSSSRFDSNRFINKYNLNDSLSNMNSSNSIRASSCSKLYSKNFAYSHQNNNRFIFGSGKYRIPKFLDPIRGKKTNSQNFILKLLFSNFLFYNNSLFNMNPDRFWHINATICVFKCCFSILV